MDSRKDEQGKKRRRKWPIVLISIFLVLGIIVGAAYAVFHHYFSMLGSLESLSTLPGAEMPSASAPAETDAPRQAETERPQPAQTENPEQVEMGAPETAQTESPGQVQTEDPEQAQTQSPEQPLDPTQEPEQEQPAVEPNPRDEAWELDEAIRMNLEARAADQYTTDAFNVLVIGLDSSSDSMTGRSDTILLISINRQTKQMLFTSFLRDIYVSIPGWGNNRLDTAYAFGGAELLRQTVQANFGIPVDRCMVLNFYIVVDLIDALGGIDLDLTAEEISVMRDYIALQNFLLGRPEDADILSEYAAGTVHVNGNQALAYTRISSVGTDFARTGRQRVVINKCLDQVKNMGLMEVSGLASAFLPRIHTDLTEGDCANMVMMLLDLGSYQIGALTIPMEGTYSPVNLGGTSVIAVDFDINVAAWRYAVDGMAGR